MLREWLRLVALDVLKHQYKYRYNCYLAFVSVLGTTCLYLKTSFALVCVYGTVLKIRKESLRETSLMRSWLGSDGTISRTLGLLIPHSGLSSLYDVSFFCGNKVSEEKQGGSPTKFKKYYPVAPSFTIFSPNILKS